MDNDLDLTYDRLLGEGSYGKVFLVKQQDGEQFAVKEIDLTKCDEDGKTQALGEAAILSRIKHENILEYIESVINDDCLYIITEYCGGGDMEDYLQTLTKYKVTVPESLVSEWIFQLGSALWYLHDQKILHRDMKTKNIFLKDDLTVKLGDMGIAKVLDMNQSKANTFIGTPSYMSPELFTGKSYNHKTDIWGLGCCAYEMMTMKRAFQGKALWTLIKEIKLGKELQLPDNYSLDIRMLVQDMMSQSPEDRPSAKDIMENDLLLYHRGQAKEEISQLPRPNQDVEKQKKSRNSANLSGSFNRMIQEKNRAVEETYRNTISQVCEKVNTLQRTGTGTMENYDTFVYRGEDDSDGELEAAGTILDSTLLEQYSQQLDTFVYKGDGDSDSDYSTGGSLVNKVATKEPEEEEQEDVSVTLVRQYSNKLEDMEDSDGEVNEEGQEEDSGKGQSPVPQPAPRYQQAPKPHYSLPPSHMSPVKARIESRLAAKQQDNEDLDFTSKYKYLGLRDTLALRPDKRWKRHSETDALLEKLRESTISENDSENQKAENSTNEAKKKDSHRPISLSSSLSSTSSFHGSKMKTSDPRLHKTLSFDSSETRTKATRVKISDRIEQSAKSKGVADIKLKSTKKAFVEEANDQERFGLTSEEQVKDVMTHLRDRLTPYTPEEGNLELNDTIKSGGYEEGIHNQGSPNSKVKKKKVGLLKKKSDAARKKSSETEQDKKSIDVSQESEANIKLFTRAQKASFSKEEEDSNISRQTNGRCNPQDLNNILTQLHEGSSNTVAMEETLIIQRELANGIGVDNLRQVLDIMSMVQNEEELQLHVMNLVGRTLFEEYKQHLIILRLLELRGMAGS